MNDTNTKFTPGPWRIEMSQTGPAKYWYLMAGDKVLGGNVTVFQGQSSMPDAHLIAAAPEMYEMLRRIVGLNVMAAFWDIPNDRSLRESIEQLLAKARGEIEECDD